MRSSNPKNLDFKVKNEKATSYKQINNYKNSNNKNIPYKFPNQRKNPKFKGKQISTSEWAQSYKTHVTKSLGKKTQIEKMLKIKPRREEMKEP